MKKFVVVIIVLSSLACILLMPFYEKPSRRNEAIASEQKPQVLLLIRQVVSSGIVSSGIDLMLKEEVGVMTSMLEEAGFTVIVASDSEELIEGQTLNLKPHLKYADVKVNNYVGIIIPCTCEAKRDLTASPEEVSIVKQAGALGIPLAAQRYAVIILAEAGVLVGKKYTTKRGLRFRESFADAIYIGKDKDISQDGKIITSKYCPGAARYYNENDGTSELTELFIEAIKN